MKTPAAILVELKKPLVIDEVEIPTLGYGQVLVQVHVTRICGSQIGEVDGVKGPDRWLPHLLGHEGGGVVLETGPEVRHVKADDRVVLHWRPGAGIESRPPTYQWGSRTANAGAITTFNRFAVVSENRLTKVPDDTPFDVCALLADTLTTGFGSIVNDAQVRVGESVVLLGCGGINLGAVLGARLAGAHPIIAVDLYDHKLERARQAGATHVINAANTDFAAAVREILGGGPDVIIDGTANPDMLRNAFGLLQPAGRCVIVGVMPHDRQLSINTLPLHFGKVLTGSHGGGSRPAVDIPRYLRMMRDCRFSVDGFISHRFTLEQVNEGMARMRSGEVIHSVIDFA